MTRDGWWWISTERMTGGFHVYRGKVIWSPPIARWATGKRWMKVCRNYRRIGAQIKHLGPAEPPF